MINSALPHVLRLRASKVFALIGFHSLKGSQSVRGVAATPTRFGGREEGRGEKRKELLTPPYVMSMLQGILWLCHL